MLIRRLIGKRLYLCSTQKPVSFYEVLGIQPDSSMDDIRIKYIELAKLYHPDINKQGTAKFQEIDHAYDILSNRSTRQKYDISIGLKSQWSEPSMKESIFLNNNQLYDEILQNADTTAQKRQQPVDILEEKFRQYSMLKYGGTGTVRSVVGWALLFLMGWNIQIIVTKLAQNSQKRRSLEGSEALHNPEGYRVSLLPLNIT